MADTIRERNFAAFKGQLDTVPNAITGLGVERNRDIEVDAFPFLVMVDGGQTVEQLDSGIKRVIANIDVEMYATADTFAGLAGALDQLYGETVKAALADITLGGIAVDVREADLTDPVIDRGQGRAPTIEAALGFEIEYWVDESDPFALAP